jgi:hypothetical protein
VSVYAGRSPAAASTSLFVINKSNGPLSLDVTFSEHPRTASVTLTVPATSLQVATVPDDGSVPTVTFYAPGMTEPMAMP